MANPIYAVSYNTESGDRGVVGYWRKKPTEKFLYNWFKTLMPDEFIDDDDGSGPGYDQFVYWEVHKLEEI